jgi:hypothetical protein
MVGEMSRVCSMYGGGVHTGFWLGKLKECPLGIPRYIWEDYFEWVL